MKRGLTIGICVLALFAWTGTFGPLVTKVKALDPPFLVYGTIAREGGGIPGAFKVSLQNARTNESIANTTNGGAYSFDLGVLSLGFLAGDQLLLEAYDSNSTEAVYFNETSAVIPQFGNSLEVNMIAERHDYPPIQDPVDPEVMEDEEGQVPPPSESPPPGLDNRSYEELQGGCVGFPQPPTGIGDWVISSTVTCTDEIVNLQGSLYLLNGGQLYFINSELIIYGGPGIDPGARGVYIAVGGAFYLDQTSLIVGDSAYHYGVFVQGTIEATGAAIVYAGPTPFSSHGGSGVVLEGSSAIGRFTQGALVSAGMLYGVFAYEAATLLISGSYVLSHGCRGVYAHAVTSLTITDSTITGNGFDCATNEKDGVYFDDTEGVMTGGKVFQNDGNGILVNGPRTPTVQYLGSNDVLIHNNNLDGVRLDSGIPSLDGVSSYDNALAGIEVNGGTPTVANVHVYGDQYGVVVNGGAPDFDGVDAHGNYADGIHVHGGNPSFNVIQISYNGLDGIGVRDASVTIQNFEICYNYVNGIYMSNAQGLVNNGNIYYNGAHGIFLVNGATPQIEYAEIYGHDWVKWAGIYVSNSAPVIGPHNHIYSNLYGVVVQGSMPGHDHPTWIKDHNEVSYSYYAGIFLISDSAAWIVDNSDPSDPNIGIHDNLQGIVIRGTGTTYMTTVTNNRIRGNTYNGMYVGDPILTAGAQIQNNEIDGNTVGINLAGASSSTLVFTNKIRSNSMGVIVTDSSAIISGTTTCYYPNQMGAQTIWDNTYVNVLLNSGAPVVSLNCIGSNWIQKLVGWPPYWRWEPRSWFGIKVQSASSTALITNNLVKDLYYNAVDIQLGSPVLTYNTIQIGSVSTWWLADGVDVRGAAVPEIGKIVNGVPQPNTITVFCVGVWLNNLLASSGSVVKVVGNTITSYQSSIGIFGVYLFWSSPSHVVLIQNNLITRYSGAITVVMSGAATITGNTIGSSSARNYWGIYLVGYLFGVTPVNMPIVVQNNDIIWSLSHAMYIWCVGGFTIGDPGPIPVPPAPPDPLKTNRIHDNAGWGILMMGGSTPTPGSYGDILNWGNVWSGSPGLGRIRQDWMAYVTVKTPPGAPLSGANVRAHSELDPLSLYDTWFRSTDVVGKTNGWVTEYWRDGTGLQHPLNPHWQFTPFYPDRQRQCGATVEQDMWTNQEVNLVCQP